MRITTKPKAPSWPATLKYSIPITLITLPLSYWLVGHTGVVLALIFFVLSPIWTLLEARNRQRREFAIELTDIHLALYDYQRQQWQIPRSAITHWQLLYEQQIVCSALVYIAGKAYELPYLDTLPESDKDALLTALRTQLGEPNDRHSFVGFTNRRIGEQ
ncbi:hypothetical protein [Salinibius halmophilus]|uniref:hypothetical protein n=1 Tax=Salinibius halmophilus TaxID=1853216 RepID=UPI000E66E0FC|nr:hypothetical protein [Salinibius halmophilus]